MEEKKDKVTRPGTDLQANTKAGIQKLSEKFSLKQELVLLLRKQALGYLCPNDVVDLGGKPYVLECGCQMIAKGFDNEITDTRGPQQTVIKYPEGPDELIFEYKGLSYFPYLGKVEVSGICSTRDSLFGTKDGQPKELKDISIPKVMKKALTNLRGTAVRKPLGLSNLTWDDFKVVGITPDKCASVDYGGKSSMKKTKLTENDVTRLADIKSWTKELFEGDTAKAKSYYLELTAFIPKDGGEPYKGQQDPDRWSSAQIKRIHTKVKKRFTEFKGNRDQKKGKIAVRDIDEELNMNKKPYDEEKNETG